MVYDHGAAAFVAVGGARASAGGRAIAHLRPDGLDAAAALDRLVAGEPDAVDGDFALAAWDGRGLRLVRDRFGVCPLYFAQVGAAVAFATEPGALLALPWVPRRIDRGRLADWLDRRLGEPLRTMFEDIRRLPPGHRLTVGPDGARLERWWRLAPRDLGLRDDAACAAAYRERFVAAVRARLGGAAVALSGGLDSAAIVGVARERGVVTAVTAVGDGPADERAYVDAVVARGGVELVTVAAFGDPFEDLDAIVAAHADPPADPHLPMLRRLYAAAAGRGAAALLHGYDGDTVVSQGYERLPELLRRGRLVTLGREIRGLSRHFGRSPLWILRRFAVGPARRGAGDPREAHAASLASGAFAFALEMNDRTLARAGLTGRYPFFDRALAELCVSLPADQKLSGGFTRAVARRAYDGLVPDVVRWRGGKADYLPGFARSLATVGRARLERELRDGDALAGVLDVDRLRRDARRFLDRGGGPEAVRLFQAVTLASWRRTFAPAG